MVVIKGRSHSIFWTIERKVMAAFTIAILIGFAIMLGLQASDLRRNVVGLATADLTDKTTQLGNAIRVGLMASDGGATETEYKPLETAPGTQLASVWTFEGDGSELSHYVNDRLNGPTLGDVLQKHPEVIGQRKPITLSMGNTLVVVVPVMSLRGTSVLGALAVGWNLSHEHATIDKAIFYQSLAALAVMVVLILLLGFLLRALVVRPIKHMTGVMHSLASGNINVTIPGANRRDEIGNMASSVRIFADNAANVMRLQAEQEAQKRQAEESRRAALTKLASELERDVKSVAEAVANAAGQMETNARDMAGTAENALQRSGTVAAAAEQASISLQTVASAAEELSASITELRRQAGGSQAVAEGAVNEASVTTSKVSTLAETAEKIGKVVSLISDIAAQTNLLALNATIEAARAGDAGKGFAVVASEVKSLATQTSHATEEITTQVAAIRTATREVVGAMQGIASTIRRINEITIVMSDGITQQGEATQEIARNVQQAAAGAAEVSSNVVGITYMSQETGRGADAILKTSRDLVSHSTSLNHSLDAFVRGAKSA